MRDHELLGIVLLTHCSHSHLVVTILTLANFLLVTMRDSDLSDASPRCRLGHHHVHTVVTRLVCMVALLRRWRTIQGVKEG